jgi:NADPH-dependent 7-cyano-7-deazaguanine reductase QueF-like protein
VCSRVCLFLIYIYIWLLSNYNIKYICTIYTRLDTCLMSISRFSLRDKVTLPLLKLYFNTVDVVEWSRALDIRLSHLWYILNIIIWQQSNSAIFNIYDIYIYIYIYIYICTIYTRLDTCLMSISRLSLREKVTLRLLKLFFYGADVVEWSRAQVTTIQYICPTGSQRYLWY